MNKQKLKEGKPSWGAEVSASYRAGESLLPEDERLCNDPVAMYFLGTLLKIVVKTPLVRIGEWFAEVLTPGNVGYVTSRTSYMDDYLRTCIEGGIEQLVILGAGYDSRAYRFEELKDKVTVFEIDHPATQRAKVGKVQKAFGTPPDHVAYIAIDFDNEKLDERMFQGGYDQNLQTLLIWEGVTMFISAEGVDATLDFIARSSGEGSSIIFDYVLQSAVDGTCKFEEAEKWRRTCENIGEPYTFGVEESAIGEFLSARGFHQVNDIGTDFLKEAYIESRGRSRTVPRHYRIVHATVKPGGLA